MRCQGEGGGLLTNVDTLDFQSRGVAVFPGVNLTTQNKTKRTLLDYFCVSPARLVAVCVRVCLCATRRDPTRLRPRGRRAHRKQSCVPQMEEGEGSVGPEYDPVKVQRSPGEDNWHLLAAYPPPAAPRHRPPPP